jgi:hypothetical protein
MYQLLKISWAVSSSAASRRFIIEKDGLFFFSGLDDGRFLLAA